MNNPKGCHEAPLVEGFQSSLSSQNLFLLVVFWSIRPQTRKTGRTYLSLWSELQLEGEGSLKRFIEMMGSEGISFVLEVWDIHRKIFYTLWDIECSADIFGKWESFNFCCNDILLYFTKTRSSYILYNL